MPVTILVDLNQVPLLSLIELPFRTVSGLLYVQSIGNKLDLLNTKLHGFDALAFSETWLNDSINLMKVTLDLFNSLK